MASPQSEFLATCRCGGVQCAALGRPIIGVICHCADCQEGGRRMEALPGADSVRDAFGGTPFILFRKTRWEWRTGADRLMSMKLNTRTVTNRVVAQCCNSGMALTFDRGPHWISAYRTRFTTPLPPIAMRIQVQSAAHPAALPRDLPCRRGFPLGFMAKILLA